ncbi:UDP-2-acetamido-2-deoxy-ribo-hexuluronate aminotransferase [Malonomonas rubra DSM 5091]|uniref:UDP-2-acetamido-2-deoxy-ribo-hexuluronate aminotransferase n=1 Tax=Malonomonas rubra DSM 5091 TaxID=1122189 RepID=A0A1M6DT59_MALRU|nr:DegT/DnrJ/EryC1/StrS family aminotransferase [Malonomonas rubra]SHI76198.1 UDP-2-acetamido-2-deoxy-ribo-hexuluronate aminotransferase [Malonomonas rubra DSM 5091]
MQFIDLNAQQERIRPQIEARIKAVLDHGKYIMGPEVFELEERLADFVGVKHCVSCASGTDALLMSLMAYGIGPGDAIFTTPFTFVATGEVISLLGATPVYVDIDPRTFNIDPQKLKEVLENFELRTPNSEQPLVPKGIIPVDLFGLPADYDSINRVAKEHGLFVVEDAAQGLGGEYKGRKAGSLADIATTSFFPAKPLGCYGDGGAIFTDNDEIAEKLRSVRVHGQGIDKYENVRIGLNGRLDTLQAAILLPKLEIFPEEIEARQRVARAYTKLLSKVDAQQIITPHVPKGLSSAWAQYSILSEDRETLRGELQQKGIPTAVYYPKPLHLQQAYADLNYNEGDFPVSEKVSSRIFSLPMHPYLEESSQQRVAEIVTESLRKVK